MKPFVPLRRARATKDEGRDTLARALAELGLVGGVDFFAEAGVRAHGRRLWVDILLPERRLAVEVDGPGHDRAADARRDALFAHHGWRVLRFRKRDVMADPLGCARQVLEPPAAVERIAEPTIEAVAKLLRKRPRVKGYDPYKALALAIAKAKD